MQCGQSVQLLNVKLLVHHVTGRIYKIKLLTVKFILILVSCLNDNMLHRNDVSVTVCNTSSKILSSMSVHFAIRLRRSCFFVV